MCCDVREEAPQRAAQQNDVISRVNWPRKCCLVGVEITEDTREQCLRRESRIICRSFHVAVEFEEFRKQREDESEGYLYETCQTTTCAIARRVSHTRSSRRETKTTRRTRLRVAASTGGAMSKALVRYLGAWRMGTSGGMGNGHEVDCTKKRTSPNLSRPARYGVWRLNELKGQSTDKRNGLKLELLVGLSQCQAVNQRDGSGSTSAASQRLQ